MNAEFLRGRIEGVPLPDAAVDVIVSNCVINLSPDKATVFTEAHRLLRPGGRLAVADVVADTAIAEAMREDLTAWTGCIAGAITREDYRSLLERAGFADVTLNDSHRVGDGLTSVIVRAVKPDTDVVHQRRATLVPGAEIEPMQAEHWPEVRRIYEAGIATGNATFDEAAPVWEAWDAAHLPEHRYVALVDGEVAGWVAAAPVSERCCYSGVIENSVYIDPNHQGRGIGQALLSALIASAEAAGIWTIQSGIFPENAASLAAHERVGFRIVGRRERIGTLHGVWRDVVALERRSKLIG